MITIDDYSLIGDNMTKKIININGEDVLHHVNWKNILKVNQKRTKMNPIVVGANR